MLKAGSKDAKSCGPCSDEQCEAFAGKQMCGEKSPYVCTAGSSRFGCSADKYKWANVVKTSCSDCCDINTCA